MNADPENPFLDALADLSQLRHAIWKELCLAARNTSHAWFLGVLGNVSERGPELRTLVLRDVDEAKRSLFWHTDNRSPKFSQLAVDGRNSVLFWDAQRRVQLTLRGTSQVLTEGEHVDEQWNRSQLTSRRAYLGDRPPGTIVDEAEVNFPLKFMDRPPEEDESAIGRENFGVIITSVTEMDLLILRQSGNLRALFRKEIQAAGTTSWWQSWICP